MLRGVFKWMGEEKANVSDSILGFALLYTTANSWGHRTGVKGCTWLAKHYRENRCHCGAVCSPAAMKKESRDYGSLPLSLQMQRTQRHPEQCSSQETHGTSRCTEAEAFWGGFQEVAVIWASENQAHDNWVASSCSSIYIFSDKSFLRHGLYTMLLYLL